MLRNKYSAKIIEKNVTGLLGEEVETKKNETKIGEKYVKINPIVEIIGPKGKIGI